MTRASGSTRSRRKRPCALGPHVMLDQERCILCSRCVRFTDEITKTGEFGIFNRGDRAELGLYPGEVLNNAYSANVVDICPVGALTERDFRFKVRVWYLSSAPTICNGCSQGCNIDLHYVLDRPHLNDGARVVRIKPRYNPDVNHGGCATRDASALDGSTSSGSRRCAGRLSDATWEQALTAIAGKLGEPDPARVGVIASAQLTNEELFLIRTVFRSARVSASVPEPPGSSDDFLIKADKNPNTTGATLLGMTGPEAPEAAQILDEAIDGNLDVLWVFGHDLVKLFGEEKVRQLAEKVPLFIYSGTNENPTVPLAHWVLPSAAYLEKDGTFVNCHGRVQRIAPEGTRPFRRWATRARSGERSSSWPASWAGRSIGRDRGRFFKRLPKAFAPFAGLSYETIGTQGVSVAMPMATAEGGARHDRSPGH